MLHLEHKDLECRCAYCHSSMDIHEGREHLGRISKNPDTYKAWRKLQCTICHRSLALEITVQIDIKVHQVGVVRPNEDPEHMSNLTPVERTD